jgi:thymidylate synthase
MSMQNKDISGNEDFITKEITNYSYCLTTLHKEDYLFLADARAKVWCDAEFMERISPDYVNPGQAWKLREYIWEEFLNEKMRFDYSYNNRMHLSLGCTIRELKRNPDSRQAIINVWDAQIDPINLGGKRRVPCSMYYQILVRKGRVNIVYNQRSADMITHFGNDVYLAWQLMLHVSHETDWLPGYLFHNIGSLHSYKKDWPQLKRCIEDIGI